MHTNTLAKKTFSLIAPGARVVIRDEEWIVRRVDHVGEGKAIHVIGVSELVRGKQATFLEQLEQQVQVLAPEDTDFVSDDSPQFRQSRLYIESLLQRYIPPLQNSPELYIGHRAAMNVLPFQLTPALQALEQPRQRILIADAVGLGKTLECGILLSELIRRGRGQRILVLTMKSILTQFQKELWSRFSIPLIRLDSDGLRRIRQEIPTNHNPFDYHDKVIISIDTLKRDSEYRRYLEQAHWDIIVIDEAHNVADRSGSKNFYGQTRHQAMRTKLARLLSTRSDTLIMLSATPHDGKAQSFASLMNMLNPTAIANPHDYRKEDIKGLFVRRFKKDVIDQVGDSFQEREIHQIHIPATSAEERVFAALEPVRGTRLGQQQRQDAGGRMLFATTLEKALFSSPAACLETVNKRIREVEKKDEGDYSRDLAALEALQAALEAITPEDFSRYQALCQLIRKMGWTGKQSDDRLVIFTERIATLNWLQAHLPSALKLKDKQVAVLYGGMSDTEQQNVVEAFGKESADVRLLIASDVASEGINLHYLSHRMIHFDIPWSLMTFQQRNGRIDRYGQHFKPEIYYLMTQAQDAKIRGDQRILELLIEKDEQAIKNIGDPSALTGQYNAEDEATQTALAMEQNLSPEAFERQSLQAESDSLEALLAAWQAADESAASIPAQARTRTLPSLYPGPLAYTQAALAQLGIHAVTPHEDGQGLTLDIPANHLPDDLRVRFRALPREVLRPDQGLKFSTDSARIQADIARCRKESNAWPEWHYLWEQHPFMDWLNDRITASLGRHQAPVLPLPTLAPDESLFLLSGLYPSKSGHPIIWEWPGVLFKGEQVQRILTLQESLAHTGFGQHTFANPGGLTLDKALLRQRLEQAVARSRKWLGLQREDFEAQFQPRMAEELNALARLKEKQRAQLALDFDNPVGAQIRQRAERERRIDQVFNDYQRWVENSMSVSDTPYLQLVAVFIGAAA